MDTLLPAKNGDVLELDELWSFAGANAQTLWLWVALCRRTRQIVGWTLDDRSQQSASALRAALPKDYRGCATRSDYWDACAAAFPERTHRCCGKSDGETCHVERWFGTLRARTSRRVRRRIPFPSTLKITWMPSSSSSPPTTSPLNGKQRLGNHYPRLRGDRLVVGRRARHQNME